MDISLRVTIDFTSPWSCAHCRTNVRLPQSTHNYQPVTCEPGQVVWNRPPNNAGRPSADVSSLYTEWFITVLPYFGKCFKRQCRVKKVTQHPFYFQSLRFYGCFSCDQEKRDEIINLTSVLEHIMRYALSTPQFSQCTTVHGSDKNFWVISYISSSIRHSTQNFHSSDLTDHFITPHKDKYSKITSGDLGGQGKGSV
jgi:hypothetical protein